MADQTTPPLRPGVAPAHVPVAAVPRTGLAVATLVVGIAGLVVCPLVGFIAIVTGIIALTRASNEPHRYGGRGMAIAGLVCGSANVLLIPLYLCMGSAMVSILVPSLSRARELSKRLVCASNMKAIGTAWKTYASDHPGEGIPSLDWLIDKGSIAPNQIICPSSGLTESNYVIVRYEPGGSDRTTDSKVVVMYEPKTNHGGEGGNFLFADGHVSFVRVPEYDQLVRAAKGDSDQRSGDDP